MEPADNELIAQYQAGSAAALDTLVRRYTNQIYAFVLRLVGSDADAEDVTQTTMVNLWRHLEKFDTKRSFRTWAFAVARNASIDFLRKRRHLKFSEIDAWHDEDGDDFASRIADDELSAEERLIRSEDAARLVEALAILEPDERAIIALHLEEDATFAEVGEVIGKSANTVKSRYRRALHKLRAELAPEADDRP